MSVYWSMYLVASLIAFLSSVRTRPNSPLGGAAALAVLISLVTIVGGRFEVGGDWGNYESNYLEAIGRPLSEAVASRDPGYEVLTWLVQHVDDGSVLLLNLLAASAYSIGLVRFSSQLPRPWLAIAVAIPYLTIVVAMGYTRQAVAIGFAMWAFAEFARRKTWYFVLLICVGATFHKSAVVLVPIAMLATPSRRLWTAVWAGATALAMYYTLVADTLDDVVQNYMGTNYSSDGAALRVAMNVVAGVLLLVFRRRLITAPAERNLWTMMAVLAIACGVWLPFSSSSTAVDRLALYLIPLQLYVASRLPELLSISPSVRFQRTVAAATLLGYGIVQFVWLFFGVHSKYWVPYQNWFFLDLF